MSSVRISRRVKDANDVEHVIEADTVGWAVLTDGVPFALRFIDEAAVILARLCPHCRVDIGELYYDGCPLRPEQ